MRRRGWSSAGTKDYDRTLSSRNALKRIGSVFSTTANHRTTQYNHRKHSTTLETPNTGNKQGRCMAEYIRVRLRFRPPLVASPSQPHQTTPNRRQINRQYQPLLTTVQHSTTTANTVLRWKHQTPETSKADVWLSIYGFGCVLDRPWSLRLPNPTKQRQIDGKSTDNINPKLPTIFVVIHAKRRNKTPTNARKAPHKALQVSSMVGYYERVRID